MYYFCTDNMLEIENGDQVPNRPQAIPMALTWISPHSRVSKTQHLTTKSFHNLELLPWFPAWIALCKHTQIYNSFLNFIQPLALNLIHSNNLLIFILYVIPLAHKRQSLLFSYALFHESWSLKIQGITALKEHNIKLCIF